LLLLLLSGLIGHVINNNIDYLVLMIMSSAAMNGGYIGARYSNRFRSLRRIFGIVLIIVAITVFWRVFDLIK